jgi:hypothetical protein
MMLFSLYKNLLYLLAPLKPPRGRHDTLDQLEEIARQKRAHKSDLYHPQYRVLGNSGDSDHCHCNSIYPPVDFKKMSRCNKRRRDREENQKVGRCESRMTRTDGIIKSTEPISKWIIVKQIA